MTLIVGLQCTDGVVIASDSMSTVAVPAGGFTVRDSTDKVLPVGGYALFAGSGSVGLIQQYHRELEGVIQAKSLHSEKLGGRHPATVLQARFAIPLQALVPFTPVNQLQGIASLLVAIPVDKRPMLIEFEANLNYQTYDTGSPYVSLGSGQQHADPLLALMRRMFFPDAQPSLQLGTLAAYWAVHSVIASTPGFVGPPIAVGILKTEGTKITSRLLSETELEEHGDSVRELEEHTRAFRKPPDAALPPSDHHPQ